MQSEIDMTNSLRQCIAKFEIENDKIKAKNAELKARIAKLEDKQLQNEMVKNLLSVSQKTWSCILGKFAGPRGLGKHMIFTFEFFANQLP